MKLKLNSVRTRLFLAIFGTCILLVFIMNLGVRASFQYGFLDYVKQENEHRTQLIAEALAEKYQEENNWLFLAQNERAFFNILRSIEHTNRMRHNMGNRQLRAQFWILDANEKQLFGREGAIPLEVMRLPIIINDNQTVGWVVASVGDKVTREIDVRFEDQQLYTSWIVAGISLLVALIATFFLARGFLRPIKRLLDGTNKLAAGDFSTRVPDASGDELGHLAKDFNHLASTLEKNEQMRRDYMADISHELRTPLSVLRGELEAVQDGVRQATPETLVSLLAETEILIKLVNDLHQLSLSDRGSLAYRKQPTDLVPLIELAFGYAQRRLGDKQLKTSLSLPDEVILLVDPDRITQLFHNLIENSLRYTEQGGQLRIQGELSAQQFILTWEDSKPGLSEEQCAQIFERFYRAEGSRNRASGGSGLGLAICYNIIEAHGGTITASPSLLGGVCIKITLPIHQMDIENL